MFQTTKIQTFESNSQHVLYVGYIELVVSDYKDTNFWKQFTTTRAFAISNAALFQTTKIQTFESNSQRHKTIRLGLVSCFRLQRYKLLKAIHNDLFRFLLCLKVVSDYKDTNFWKQFTTTAIRQTASFCCFRLQRYKLLKAIHNYCHQADCVVLLFQTTKIQTFESNSQLSHPYASNVTCCFRLQRYKLLKAIHNSVQTIPSLLSVVSDYKDTNFWKQFTTVWAWASETVGLFQTTKIQTFESNSQLKKESRVDISLLFQTTKIQTFESNSQRHKTIRLGLVSCFRLQRYKLLKAIHNNNSVRDILFLLFQTTKIQTFESNSQHYVRGS